MSKLTFDQAMEMIAEHRHVDASNVQATALRRKVWQMMYSAPGCLPDHFDVCTTKAGAIASAVELYGDEAPRGFKSQLRRHGIARTDAQGYYRVEIHRMRLADLF